MIIRGRLISMLTPEQHRGILNAYKSNVDAAEAYSGRLGTPVTRQNVKYWRNIFTDNKGNRARTNRQLREMQQYIKPEPDDDLGAGVRIPEVAKRILVIPDIHAPYQHKDTIAFLAAVRDEIDPDLVVNLGDEVDMHAMSFHDSDPNLDSAGAELEQAKVFLEELHNEFPEMLICHSNHGSMLYRKAKAHGIPVQMLKRYRDILFPEHGADGWSWKFGWRIQTPAGVVYFKHQASGDPIADAAHNQCNLVTGHEHGKFDINYAASSALLYWAMRSGCLIDKDALAFAYGKHTKNKPIIGCSAIIDGQPLLIPMLLDAEGNWTGKLK